MFKPKANNKGVIFLFVIVMLMVAVCLTIAALSQVLSHSRLTLHYVSRMQAYYANLAGLNLAMEKLRLGTWTTGSYTLCSSGCDVNDTDIPYSVTITIFAPGTSIACSPGDPSCTDRKITASTTYTAIYTY